MSNYILSQGWSYTNGKGLWFRVKPKDDLDFMTEENAQLVEETTVYGSFLSRVFNPLDYNKDG